MQEGCYLPSNPDSLVIDIDKNSGQPMQSAAKAPYLARFKVRHLGINEMEKCGLEMAKEGAGAAAAPKGEDVWQAAIFKVIFLHTHTHPIETFKVLRFREKEKTFFFPVSGRR